MTPNHRLLSSTQEEALLSNYQLIPLWAQAQSSSWLPHRGRLATLLPSGCAYTTPPTLLHLITFFRFPCPWPRARREISSLVCLTVSPQPAFNECLMINKWRNKERMIQNCNKVESGPWWVGEEGGVGDTRRGCRPGWGFATLAASQVKSEHLPPPSPHPERARRDQRRQATPEW